MSLNLSVINKSYILVVQNLGYTSIKGCLDSSNSNVTLFVAEKFGNLEGY
jgi:hypothetical protein